MCLVLVYNLYTSTMKPVFKWILIILAILFVVGGVLIYTSKHKKLKFDLNEDMTVYSADTSTLVFPLYIAVNDLENLANSRLKTQLIDKRLPVNEGKDTLVLKVTRKGGLKVRYDGGTAYTSMPLVADIQFIKKFMNKGVTVFKKEPLRLDLTVHAKSQIKLREDLTLASSSDIERLEWHSDPSVKVMGINFDVKKQIEKILLNKQDEITGALDDVIGKKLNIKRPIENIWNSMQKSIVASKKIAGIYIRIQPHNIKVHIDQKNSKDSLKINLVFKANAYVRYGNDTLNVERNAFPKKVEILRFKDTTSMSDIHIHMLLPMLELNKILAERVSNTPVAKGTFNLVIKEVQIANTKENILVKVDHTGTINGTTYVKGRPQLSKDNSVLEITNLQYENVSKDHMLNSMEDLLHDEIMNFLNDKLRFEIGDFVSDLSSLAQNAIDKSKLSEKSDISVNELVLQNVKFHLTKNNIQIIGSAKSDLAISLNKDTFKRRFKKPRIIKLE